MVNHIKKMLFLIFGFAIIYTLSVSNYSFAYEKEIKDLSHSMSENITRAGKKSIAVVDFTDLQGNVTELGRFLAEEFSVALAGAGKGFEVVDRTHLKTIIKEHKLAITGIIDPATAKKLGQIAGVDALVTGSITPFGDSVRISVKILDTTTARVIGASSGNIAKTKAIEELLGREVKTEAQAITQRTSVSPTKVQQIVEAHDCVFELQHCTISGQTVKCKLEITNKGKNEKYLRFYEFSRMLDDLGNEYVTNDGNFIRGNNDSINLAPNSLATANIKFSNVSTRANRITFLEIELRSYPNSFKIQFRNIPLSR